MSLQKLVTIIVVVYNTEEYLMQCLTSILEQSYGNLEILLLNNGSTDHSMDIMQEVAGKDKRVSVIDIGKKTVSYARNYGVRMAKGSYVTFVDSDDFVDTNYIEKLVNAKEKYHAQLSVCNLFEFSDMNCMKEKSSGIEEKIVDGKQMCEWMNRFVNLCTVMTVAWNKLYDTAELKKYAFPDRSWGEDIFFMYRYLYNLERVIIIPDRLYYWRENPNSLSRRFQNTPKQVLEVEAYEERANFFLEQEENKLYILTLRRQLYVMAQQIYKQKVYNAGNKAVIRCLKTKIKDVYPRVRKDRGWSFRTRLLFWGARYFSYCFGRMSCKYHFDLER